MKIKDLRLVAPSKGMAFMKDDSLHVVIEDGAIRLSDFEVVDCPETICPVVTTMEESDIQYFHSINYGQAFVYDRETYIKISTYMGWCPDSYTIKDFTLDTLVVCVSDDLVKVLNYEN